MNRLKLLRFLFVLFIVLTVVFGIGLIVPESRGNVLGRIGLWCGFIATLVNAILQVRCISDCPEFSVYL